MSQTYTTGQVASLIGCRKPYAARLLDEGTIPCHRDAKNRRRVRRADLVAFMTQRGMTDRLDLVGEQQASILFNGAKGLVAGLSELLPAWMGVWETSDNFDLPVMVKAHQPSIVFLDGYEWTFNSLYGAANWINTRDGQAKPVGLYAEDWEIGERCQKAYYKILRHPVTPLALFNVVCEVFPSLRSPAGLIGA